MSSKSMIQGSEFALAELCRDLPLNEAAKAVVAKFAGFRVSGLAEVGEGSAGHAVCVGTPELLQKMLGTKPGVVFLQKDLQKSHAPLVTEAAAHAAIIIPVNDAKLTLAHLSEFFSTEAPPIPGVHPTAQVDPSVRLGANVSIGAFVTIAARSEIADNVEIQAGCRIGAAVKIGAKSKLFANVVVYDRVLIGAKARIHSGVILGSDGFGYAQERTNLGVQHRKIHHLGSVRIGEDVEIGANTTIDRGTLSDTIIGDGCRIDNQVQIGHNCQIGRGVIICGNCGLAGSAKIGDFSVIAGMAGIGHGADIGVGAIIGGMAGVQSKVAPGEVVVGMPARSRAEFFRIQGALGHLPEIYRYWRQSLRQGKSVGANDSPKDKSLSEESGS